MLVCVHWQFNSGEEKIITTKRSEDELDDDIFNAVARLVAPGPSTGNRKQYAEIVVERWLVLRGESLRGGRRAIKLLAHMITVRVVEPRISRGFKNSDSIDLGAKVLAELLGASARKRRRPKKREEGA